MSTTAVVTPYDPETEAIRNEIAATEEKALAKHRDEARKNRLFSAKMPVTAESRVNLEKSVLIINTKSLSHIRLAAETMGYKASLATASKIELTNASGHLVRLTKTSSGKVEIASPKTDLTAVHAIVQQYTASNVVNHMNARGMNVAVKRTPHGEIAIEAIAPDKKILVKTDIRKDGIAVIDVEGIKGQKCQEIITDISLAMGGSQIDTARKNDYFITVEEEENIHV